MTTDRKVYIVGVGGTRGEFQAKIVYKNKKKAWDFCMSQKKPSSWKHWTVQECFLTT